MESPPHGRSRPKLAPRHRSTPGAALSQSSFMCRQCAAIRGNPAELPGTRVSSLPPTSPVISTTCGPRSLMSPLTAGVSSTPGVSTERRSRRLSTARSSVPEPASQPMRCGARSAVGRARRPLTGTQAADSTGLPGSRPAIVGFGTHGEWAATQPSDPRSGR